MAGRKKGPDTPGAGDEDDKVGPGNPPKHSQWQKGQSGNPRGRPKGTRDWSVVAEEELAQMVTVTEGGKSRRLTKQQIAVKSLVNELCRGNLKAWPIILQMTDKIANDNDSPFTTLGNAHLASFIARYRPKKRKADND